jgi:hypothetical protein
VRAASCAGLRYSHASAERTLNFTAARPAARHAKFALTEESVMGIFSRFGTRKPADEGGWLRRLVVPTGHRGPKTEEIQRAAAADVAQIREDDKYFSPDAPGDEEDDL